MNDTLYNLLPLIYRQKDVNEGEPFRALMAVLESAHDKVQQDITQLYENWFIETCEEDYIPYIADLVGLNELEKDNLLPEQRRFVSNYIAYNRRNGIDATLHNVIHDVTGFYCFVVAENQNTLSIWTTRNPNLNTKSFSCNTSSTLTDATPFETNGKTLDIKKATHATLQSDYGNIHPRTVSLYLWQKTAIPYTKAVPTPSDSNAQRCFISPLQHVMPVCNQPIDLMSPDDTPNIMNYPTQLNRANASLFMNGGTNYPSPLTFYERDKDTHHLRMLPNSAIMITDLSDWQPINDISIRLLCDPELGRILLQDKTLVGNIFISYSTMSHSYLGAHAMYRRHFIQDNGLQYINDELPQEALLINTLKKCSPDIHTILVSGNNQLIFSAPVTIDLAGNNLTLLAENYSRPIIEGDLIIKNSGNKAATFSIVGFLIKGNIHIHDNASLEAEYVTIHSPKKRAITIETTNHLQHGCIIKLKNVMMESLSLPHHASFIIQDSILHLYESEKPLHTITLERSTIFGSIATITATLIENSIITGTLKITRSNGNILHHSYIGMLESNTHIISSNLLCGTDQPCNLIFISKEFGQADYGILAIESDNKILTGATNSEEIGAYNMARFRLKESNLKHYLTRYLPVGLEARTIIMD